jgi:hypothetical protein
MEKHLQSQTKMVDKSKARTHRTFRKFFSRHRPKHDAAVQHTSLDANPLTNPTRLCSTCMNIDWNVTLRGEKPSLVRKVLEVDLLNQADCIVCEFLTYSLGPHQRLARHDLLAIQIDPTLTSLLNITATNLSVLGLVPKWDFGFCSMFEFQSDLIFEVSVETASSLKPIQPLIDLDDVRQWLELCLDGHADCCGPSGVEACGLWVIDCLSRRVIARPDDAAYATLSYVWGPRNHEKVDTPIARSIYPEQSSLLDLPQTVEDAISVTLDMGYQYLWVDKYCMDPDDDTFHTQLRQMNLVYQNSVFTIIAAAGNDSLYGLPGVSHAREGSPQITVEGVTISTVPISIVKDLESKVWNTRGWTYQEGLLSTRRLIFTSTQVYFECQGYYFFEGILVTPTCSSRHYMSTQGGFSGTINRRILGMTERESYKLGVFPENRIEKFGDEIWHRIEEYTTRSLTFDSDILNAMLGLFELFDQLFQVQHLWGIPYPSQDTASPYRKSPMRLRKVTFLNQLNWDNGQTLSARREAFPSWSWTGWHGRVYSSHFTNYYNISPSSRQWSEESYYWTDNPEFSLQLEKIDGTLIHWDFCEPCDSNVITDEPQASPSNHKELTRFLHLRVFVSKILQSSQTPHWPGHSNGILESDSIDEDDVDISINLNHPDFSPAHHQLYALHMPFKTSWLLVIRQLGDHWERVGIVRGRMRYRGDTLKRTLMHIRLG